MEGKGFYIGKVVKFGWEKAKTNVGFFIGILITAFLIQTGPRLLADQASKDSLFFGLILYAVAVVLQVIMRMGLINIALKFAKDKKASFGDLFIIDNFFSFIIASILYGLIILGGMVLLIFPAIIWGIKFQLYPYFIVEKGLGPVEALKASSQATMDVKWDLLGLSAVLATINMIGLISLVLGLFVTVPLTMIAMALVYCKLTSEVKAEAQSIQTEGPATSV